MNSFADRRGIVCAATAFLIWGLSPIFFKALAWLPATEIVAHRVLWSVPLLALWLALHKGFGKIRDVFANKRLFALLCLTTLLTASNWLLYVWAVVNGHTVEASLGYFINPLCYVALGGLLLGERLRTLQWFAVGLAATGVVLRVIVLGHLPWIALAIAGTFGSYGLLRKHAPVDSISGLFVETLIALPIAAVFLLWLAGAGTLHGSSNAWAWLLLPLAGVITTVPLALFAEGARRLPLSQLGFLQYLAPTLQFLCAVVVFGEPFDSGQLGSFALIWLGLAIYSWDTLRRARGK